MTQKGFKMKNAHIHVEDISLEDITLEDITPEDGNKSFGGDITPEQVGRILFEALRRMDNWDPVTCPLDELRDNIEMLEFIEELVTTVSLRPSFLRGVLFARVTREAATFDAPRHS